MVKEAFGRKAAMPAEFGIENATAVQKATAWKFILPAQR